MPLTIKRVAQLKTLADLRAHLQSVGADIPFDESITPNGPLAQPVTVNGRVIGNRFAILPMEGWDGTPDGKPSDLTIRRWQRFGQSGAKLIWGGEAVAVRPDGRANPNQLVINSANLPDLAKLRETLVSEHAAAFGRTDDLLVGLQLTHSGRFARPNDKKRLEPMILYRHPVLDRKFGLAADHPVMTDSEVSHLVADFVTAAKLSADAGYDFVDVKHCHGYLLHEFLAARTRGGRFGGPSLADRTRLAFAVLDAVRAAAPRLRVGVRLSLFDVVPHRRSEEGIGRPEPHPLPYSLGFGVDAEHPERADLAEPIAFVRALVARGVGWINVTATSPYYAPHAQRPALFPPSDGYPPPEDPLAGVARLLEAARALKQAVPEAVVVSSGWTYLQEWIPHVAQACLRAGWFDAVGLGRMALSYPDLPADALAGRTLERGRLCRTFSDCTSAPRAGLVSGCYPLDSFYRERPERRALEARKRESRA
jgi:2,4-dienoyl-CoA reductase-like NADH-dependent reductase (Old Yellow Enzyme family)